LDSVVGYEIDEVEASKARQQAAQMRLDNADVIHGDFLFWSLTAGAGKQFDGVLGNPPFVRYQFLPASQQELAQKIFFRSGLAFTKHTNAWVPFVVSSLYHLKPGGRMAMVIPSELLHVPHAKALREYLISECSRVLVIDPVDIWMDNVLQGIVLLLAEKKPSGSTSSKGLAIVRASTTEVLANDPNTVFKGADWVTGSALDGKWMRALLSQAERDLLAEASSRKEVARFDEVASVDVGIVTGANDFFVVNDEVVSEYGLAPWSHPIFGRSAHVKGVIFTQADYAENKANGLPTHLLWFKGERLKDLTPGARKYIALGEKQGLPNRYKCKIRTPWYEVPSVYATALGMLKRSHNFPRVILNEAAAFTTDTCYRIKTTRIGAHRLVTNFVNSLTALSAEIEGRHYGGGVLELVPSEIERLLIPTVGMDPSRLPALDQDVRSLVPGEELFRRQDDLILKKVGFNSRERDELFAAYSRLRDRRKRVVATEPEG
jgi:adenine-specific DNA methylase